VAALILGIFLLPVLYVWVAREQDTLPERIRRKSKPGFRSQLRRSCISVAFPQRRIKKKQALYQGTASAVPERDDSDWL